jgi:hypothetical protein
MRSETPVAPRVAVIGFSLITASMLVRAFDASRRPSPSPVDHVDGSQLSG